MNQANEELRALDAVRRALSDAMARKETFSEWSARREREAILNRSEEHPSGETEKTDLPGSSQLQRHCSTREPARVLETEKDRHLDRIRAGHKSSWPFPETPARKEELAFPIRSICFEIAASCKATRLHVLDEE